MSQLTVVSRLPLGMRNAEIMEEKGQAFSQRAFAARIGFSKDTFGRMITGERPIMMPDLKKIAEGLSISVDRIRQSDLVSEQKELLEKLDNKKDLHLALKLAQKHYSLALGITEKCDASVNLARAVYAHGDYNQAHELLLQAYQQAEKIYQKYNESEKLYHVLSRLMITFTVRKEFSHLSDILCKVENIFSNEPEKQGALFFSKAMIAEQFGNMQAVRENLYQSLKCYRLTNKENDIGRAEQNVGYFEFKTGNYPVAKSFLESAIHYLKGDLYYQLIAIKELAKVSIKLDEKEYAVMLLEQEMKHLEDMPDLKAKYLLLLSVAKDDISYAEAVLTLPNTEQKILRLTCKYLTKYYIGMGDSEAVMKYAIIEDGLSLNHSDIIHEEDL